MTLYNCACVSKILYHDIIFAHVLNHYSGHKVYSRAAFTLLLFKGPVASNLFEGGIYSRVHGIYSRVASIRGWHLFKGGI